MEKERMKDKIKIRKEADSSPETQILQFIKQSLDLTNLLVESALLFFHSFIHYILWLNFIHSVYKNPFGSKHS